MEDKDLKDENIFDQPEMDINADADIPGDNHLSNPVEMEMDSADTEKLQAELQEQKDKYLRQAAEFENYKRRTAKERMELFPDCRKRYYSQPSRRVGRYRQGRKNKWLKVIIWPS